MKRRIDDGDDMKWYNAHKIDVSKAIANGVKDFFGLVKNEPNLTRLEGQPVVSVPQMRSYIKTVNSNVPDSVLKMIPYGSKLYFCAVKKFRRLFMLSEFLKIKIHMVSHSQFIIPLFFANHLPIVPLVYCQHTGFHP